MADRSSLGASGAPFEVWIERGKIREFARATRSAHPRYMRDTDAVSPPTFLTTMRDWAEYVSGSDPWRLVKLDPKRGMHAEQEYIFHGPPPRAGDRLVATSRIAEIYDKEGRRGGTLTFAVMVTEFRNDKGELVAEARLTGVETARPPSGESQTE